jgi:ketosteroid isomerase-like protein
MAADGTLQNENELVVRRYYEHFNAHRWGDMAAMYSPNAEFKDPSLGMGIVVQTREQIVEKYSGLAEMFPDIRDTVVATYPSGPKHIIVEFVSSGTAPDGSSFELPICTIFTIEDGVITQDFTYYDNFGEG